MNVYETPHLIPPVIKNRLGKIFLNPGLWSFLLMTVAAVLGLRFVRQLGGFQAVQQTLGLTAPLMTIPLHVVVSVSPLPSDVVCIANGAYYGVVCGAICNWIGWYISAIICFWIGRRFPKELVVKATEKLPVWLRNRPLGHPLVLILARQIPGVGGYLTTYGAGALGVSWVRHLWCSALAIIPGSITLALAGRLVI